jgi:hypothetical protein
MRQGASAVLNVIEICPNCRNNIRHWRIAKVTLEKTFYTKSLPS